MNVADLSENLVHWLVVASWQLAISIAIVAVATTLLKNAAPRLRHGLWLLVLVKALLPPTLGGPSLPAPWAAGSWAVAPVTDQLPDAARQLVTLPALKSPPTESPAKRTPFATDVAPAEAIDGVGRSPSLYLILAAVWLLGAMIVATALIVGYTRVRRAVRRLVTIDEGPARVALERAAIAIGLPDADAVDLRLSGTPAATFLIGVRRPTIVISQATVQKLAPEELVGVFAHELVHWRRRDTLVGWLQAIVVSLYWFHPLVWWAATRLRDERERCCDYEVLRRSAVTPDRYGEAIVRSLTLGQGRPSGLSAPVPLAAAGMVGVFERGSALQQRMEDIMAFQPSRGRFGWPSLALLAAFAAVFVPLAGASVSAKLEGEVELVNLSLDDTSESGIKIESDTEKKVEGKASTRVTTKWPTTVCLAEIEKPEVENAQLIYSAMVRSDLDQSASLEMWAHVDGGVYFSRNPAVAVFGKSDWKRLEIPFFFKEGQKPDKVTLNLIIGGPGKVWVDDIRLSKRPLPNGFGAAAPAGEKLSPVKKEVAAGKAEKKVPSDLPYPSVVKSDPEIGATDVSPSLDEISVTFDRDMTQGDMSWTGGGEEFPMVDKSRQAKWINARTCVLPVRLEKGRFYRVGINAKSAQNFKGADGTPAAHAVIAFATEGAKRSVANKARVPEIVELSPADEAGDVDPSTKSISVTFDTRMAGGMSWVKTDSPYPGTATGRPTWSKDGKTCTLPVDLQPGVTYRLSLNGSHYLNFQSDDGVPAPVTVWSFTTKAK